VFLSEDGARAAVKAPHTYLTRSDTFVHPLRPPAILLAGSCARLSLFVYETLCRSRTPEPTPSPGTQEWCMITHPRRTFQSSIRTFTIWVRHIKSGMLGCCAALGFLIIMSLLCVLTGLVDVQDFRVALSWTVCCSQDHSSTTNGPKRIMRGGRWSTTQKSPRRQRTSRTPASACISMPTNLSLDLISSQHRIQWSGRHRCWRLV